MVGRSTPLLENSTTDFFKATRIGHVKSSSHEALSWIWLVYRTPYDLSFDYFSDLHGCHQVWLAYQNGVLIYNFSGPRLSAIDGARETLKT